jgi:hypothetical protein
METVPAPVRRQLLEMLMLTQAERAAGIGRLYGEDGESRRLAERLMDLEADRTYALIVADVLKEQLREP